MQLKMQLIFLKFFYAIKMQIYTIYLCNLNVIKYRKGTVPTPSLDIAMSSLLRAKYGKNVPNYCDGPPGGG